DRRGPPFSRTGGAPGEARRHARANRALESPQITAACGFASDAKPQAAKPLLHLFEGAAAPYLIPTHRWITPGFLELGSHDATVGTPLPRSARAFAVRPPSRVRRLPRRGLALRGHHRNVHPAFGGLR